MAYVESRLSTRGGASASAEPLATEDAAASTEQQQRSQMEAARRQGVPGTMQSGTSTTSWTKLVEVDVPADLRGGAQQRQQHNARKRGAPESTDAPKPPPRRRRHRRGSDDVKRDAMVEAFLSENKRTSSCPPPFPNPI